MFQIKSINFLNKLHDNQDWNNYLPVAIIYDKDTDEQKSVIFYDRNYDNKENKEKNKINSKKCPRCKKVLSNKYNAQRHYDEYCIYARIQKAQDDDAFKKNRIDLADNEIIKSQYPNPVLRDICFIAGPQGSGKSTYVKNYIKGFMDLFNVVDDSKQKKKDENSFNELFDESNDSISDSFIDTILENPEYYKDILDDVLNNSYDDSYDENSSDDIEEIVSFNSSKNNNKKENDKPSKHIYLLSRIEDDESFRDLISDGTIIPIDLNNKDIITTPIDSKKEIGNSLAIFDDYELLDKKVQKSVEITLKDVLLNGRDQANKGHDIYCAVTGHQLSNRDKTRDILNECSTVSFFPKAGGVHSINYTLSKYCGLSKKQIEKIIVLPSRWITIHKRYPNYILWSGGVASTESF